jgi:SET domain-containing protein
VNDLSYRSPKTEVRESAIHGQGLFSVGAISAGEVVAVKGGYVLPKKEWATLEQRLGPAEIQISEELFIAPTHSSEREGCMLYTNHSCDPNIGIQGQIVFVAMNDIATGEELTHDWATTDDQDYTMKCHCGSSCCRSTITGHDWMRKELQEKYKGWFSWHIQKKIEG